MNKFYCGVCGKLLRDEEKFTTENGLVICKECYDAFQFDESSGDDTFQSKEPYTENVFQIEESSGDDTFQSEEPYTDDALKNQYNNNYNNSYNENKNISGNVWTRYLKTMCYITWAAITIIFALIGKSMFAALFSSSELGLLFGGVLGFAIGFANIAIIMAFISLCEDISAVRKNSDKILDKLNDGNK